MLSPDSVLLPSLARSLALVFVYIAVCLRQCRYTGCIDDHYGLDQYHIVYDDDGWEEWICLPSVH
jgi:hypothetical protein